MSSHPKGIFNLSRTRFERGVFELSLEKNYPFFLNALLSLGNLRGRLLALSLILGSALLKLYNQPARLLLSTGWVGSDWTPQLGRFQDISSWVVFVLGLSVYASVFLFRRETLILTFEKGNSQLRYLHSPLLAKSTERERLFPFSRIVDLRVYGPERIPHTSHGFFEIKISDDVNSLPSVPQFFELCFAFLTDEQRQFFPLNISKIIDKEPKGDWVDVELRTT